MSFRQECVNRSSDSAEPGRNYAYEVKKESRSGDRVKKKSSWYNVLYPTYKSRSEDFKRIFKDVPDDERLVVGEKEKTPIVIACKNSVF